MRVRFSPLEKMSEGDEKMREENVGYSNQLRVKCIGILIMKHNIQSIQEESGEKKMLICYNTFQHNGYTTGESVIFSSTG